jgi:hypothetical protein
MCVPGDGEGETESGAVLAFGGGVSSIAVCFLWGKEALSLLSVVPRDSEERDEGWIFEGPGLIALFSAKETCMAVEFKMPVVTEDGLKEVVFHAFRPRRELAGYGRGHWAQTLVCSVGGFYLEIERSMSDFEWNRGRRWSGSYVRTDHRFENRMPLDVGCCSLREYAEQVALLM